MKEIEKITIRESGKSKLLWPYIGEVKALSSSSLISILKEIEYDNKKIPEFVLAKAAENGKIFHTAIQKFLENGNDDWYKNLNLSRKTLIKIEETVLFLKKKSFKNFLGMEKLYHKSYKGEFFATYVDLDFIDFIIELKTNNVIINESSISVLAFRMQLLIQSICTEKNVWLLWSTGNGVFFEKFQPESELFEILAILIDIFQKKEIYSFETKKKIVEKMLSDYLKQARGFNLKGY